MTIFSVDKYVIRPEKDKEYQAIRKKWAAYMKRHKEKCKELKSWRLFFQMIGDNVSGGYIEMWEFDSLADYEKLNNRLMQDKEIQAMSLAFFECLVPATYSSSIWNPVV